MIVQLEGLADNIVAIQARGQVSGADYDEVLRPLVDKTLATFKCARLFYQIGPDFKRFTTTALWDDAQIGLHHLHGFERIAIVTDVEWIAQLAERIGPSLPGELRCFGLADAAGAKSWIAAEQNGPASMPG